MEKIAILTLGCKTNQYESQALGEILEKEGFEVFYHMDKADIYIINTCAVTNEAERKSRQFVSKLTKLNPKCKIYVCGCASQNNPEQFSKMPNVKYVIGSGGRHLLLEKICGHKTSKKTKTQDTYEDIHITKPVNSRVYVKIQDGCNRFCSYCLIPYLRGRSRSRSIISILQEIDNLKNLGAKEIVLTGIDISDYRIDDQPSLLELLKQIDTFDIRYRLGSMEPNLLTEEFVKELANLHNFCPHFHISMQSGCTETLKRMNRQYTAEFFIEKTKLIRKHFKNPAITTDLIIGFLGETEQEFKTTLKTIKKIGFAEMHIFPYSRRGGTAADKLLLAKQSGYELIAPQIIKERMKTTLALAQKLKNRYLKKQKNVCHEAVIEETLENYLIGTTENYIKVYIEGNCENLLNTLQKVKVIKPFKDGVLAVFAE